MRKLLLKTYRDVKVRKAQFLALIVLVALGITSYVAFITSYMNLKVSVGYANEQLKLADFETKVFGASSSVVKKIERIPGVKAVQGRLIIDTGLEVDKENEANVRVIGIPGGHRAKVDDVLMLEGEYLDEGAKRECLLHNTFAKEAGKKVGDTLTIRTDGQKKKFRIAGIAASPEYFFAVRGKGDIPIPKEFAIIFVDQREVEKIFGRPATYNDIAVLVEKGAGRNGIIEETEDILEPFRVIETVKSQDQPSNFSVNEEIKQNQTMAQMMPALILIISSLALYIALSRLVQSQRGEIGLSKALGYSDWQILLHYLFFSLIIAAGGSALGFALGNFCGKLITQNYVDLLNIPILRHQIHPEVVANAIYLSLTTCVLAGLMPAFSSVRVPPARAMRADPNVALSGGRISVVERILSPVLPSSFTFRMPLRNVSRARKRSAYTIVGIVFALVLTVATWSMFDSLDYLINYQFKGVEKWDIMAAFDQNFSYSRIEEVGHWKGIGSVQGALMIPAALSANGKKHDGAITGMKPDADFHGFKIAEGDDPQTALNGDGLILPLNIAKKLKVKVGDEVRVKTPFLNESESIEVASVSDEMWGTPIFTSIKEGKKLIRSQSDVYNSIYIRNDARYSQKIKDKLYDEPGTITVQVKSNFLKLISDRMGFAYFYGAVLFAFGAIMAFIVIYNTFTANVIERTREIATMMTIGEDRSHLATMITLENLLLAVFGIPLGLYLGLLTANSLYQSMSTEAYSIRAVIYPQSYIWITASILLILLLSEIPPIRRVFRFDLAEGTKVME